MYSTPLVKYYINRVRLIPGYVPLKCCFAVFKLSANRYGTHWARIQKKVQKPPQSTHQIPGFFCQKIQKEWIVEEFSLVNFSKKIKNWQKSMKRVVIP